MFFYNKSGTTLSTEAVPVSNTNPAIYNLNMFSYNVSGLGGAAASKVSLTSINGALVIVSPAIDAILLKRDPDTGVFTDSRIKFRARDFDYQGDKATYFNTDPAPSIGRQYDTINSGWVGAKGAAALVTYKAATSGDHPPLTHAWFAGKNATGDFDAPTWKKVFAGTSMIANGHFIMDLFFKNRDLHSGLVGVPSSIENSRFKSATTYAGRAWFGGLASTSNSSRVYFSPIVTTVAEIGDFFQVNDPTSENAVLLDTDGGFINISGASNISKMAVMGSSLIVFAENGVWEISGVDEVFRASEHSIRKITDIGLTNPTSFVDAEGAFLWWSPSGIHTLSFDPTIGRPVESNISVSTIQTFWDGIGAEERSRCVSEYDYRNKKVFWLFPAVGETIAHKFNRVLVLDTILQAFYPWTVSDQASNSDYIIGTAFVKDVGSGSVNFTVVDNAGNVVTTASGDTVIITKEAQTNFNSSGVLFFVRDGDTGKTTFAKFSSVSFLDWGDADYSSFAESGYDFNGDITTRKTAPFISVVMGVTETGWTGSEVLGYTRVRPSSLKVAAYWDFKDTPSSTPQQAYRLKTVPVVDPTDLSTFGYPTSVITTRLKLRGRGQSVRLRFDSETGQDFNLLGWEMIGERSNKL
ncbi:MAG: hypothetical protein JKY50_00115 [Oleispira sp.]|nr:hypothetical protein [Oleispira sp.]